MCGLTGIASCHPVHNDGFLLESRDSLCHRGPDDAGIWWSDDRCVGLAHRRLSILDLSPLGHQPMQDRSGRYTIVFNGEIYNYADLKQELVARGCVFRSQSDTEVLLEAYAVWGEACLSRLQGMFAFALFDAKERVLLLARDPVGEKPLFYRQEKECISFASELKALLTYPAAPRQIDADALDCYLAMGYVPGGRCLLRGYNKLAPGHALCYDLTKGESKLWRYYTLPELAPDAEKTDERELLAELESLLEKAVARQMVADVPVGVLLSGGVDSSLVTAMAVRSSKKVQTFCIGFPGYGALDETAHAAKIASHFGTDHTELMADETTADLIPLLARQFDEPMSDSSMVPTYLVSQLVRQHCTVALGGDGGDELFGGYPHYNRLLWLEKYAAPWPSCLRRAGATIAERLLPLGFAGGNLRTWMMAAGQDLTADVPPVAGFFDPLSRQRLLHNRFTGVAEDIRRSYQLMNGDLLQRATRMDFTDYLPEDILVKVDRVSMLHALEVRAPLLDHTIVSFAFSRVPSHLKASLGGRKILLKKLAAKLLPPSFDLQRKQGFCLPLSTWLQKGSFRDLFHDVLTSRDVFFDPAALRHLLEGQDRGRNNAERLFALVLFELWRKTYSIQDP